MPGIQIAEVPYLRMLGQAQRQRLCGIEHTLQLNARNFLVYLEPAHEQFSKAASAVGVIRRGATVHARSHCI